MVKHLSVLCNGCKKPIGTANHIIFVDHEYGQSYFFHNQHVHDCWNKVQRKVEEDYCWLIHQAQRRTPCS